MIVVVTSKTAVSEEALSELHDRLSKEINSDDKHKVMCVPTEFNVEIINDYDLRNAYVVTKGE